MGRDSPQKRSEGVWAAFASLFLARIVAGVSCIVEA